MVIAIDGSSCFEGVDYLCYSAGPPTISEPFQPAYHHIIGQQFMLECSATNDDDSPNNITFVWLKDDKQLNSSIVMQTGLLRSSLFIQQLDPKNHSGNYSCGAYNNEMSDSVFTNTTVTIESELVVLLHRYIYLKILLQFPKPLKIHQSKIMKQTVLMRRTLLPMLSSLHWTIPMQQSGTLVYIIYRYLYFMLHRHLFVVVTTGNRTEPSQIPDNLLVNYDQSKNSTYVAVVVHNMSGDQWEKMLVLGGGNITELVDSTTNPPTIKRYHNIPLVRGTTYFTFVRAYAYDHNDTVSVVVDCMKWKYCEHYRIQDMHQVATQSQLVSIINMCIRNKCSGLVYARVQCMFYVELVY